MLNVGTKAPDFCLPDQNGELRRLSDYAGSALVLYFYSRDGSLGCTRQAQGFAARYAAFQEKGAAVVGVSKDSPAAHQRFAAKQALPFTLLADESRETQRAYDVLKAKTDHGKQVLATLRAVYIIDGEGVIRWAGQVKASDDPAALLELL